MEVNKIDNIRGLRSKFCYMEDNKNYYKGINKIIYYYLAIKNKIITYGGKK